MDRFYESFIFDISITKGNEIAKGNDLFSSSQLSVYISLHSREK